MNLFLYDTTLRDGTQREGLSFSVEDKLKIARLLDGFGIPYIEGGWPGSNPKDAEFFRRVPEIGLRQAKIVAFGSTRRASSSAGEDANLQALLAAETPAVALVGKSSLFHVRRVLETTPAENLSMIGDSVRWMKKHAREVIFDAEHFFDGFRDQPAYALDTIRSAADAGADWIVLCDTNGGSLPDSIRKIVSEASRQVHAPLGVHTHNDGELAVANALAAVEAGATQVQGTINGYGERCGNANLVSLAPTLQLKMGLSCVPPENLKRLAQLSRTVSEIANLSPDPHAPYVGASAFAHKGGIHVSAVEKAASSYEHIEPGAVGNRHRVVVSELSGRGNVRMRGAEMGLSVNGLEGAVLDRIKELESRGFQFEAAEGSFELLVRRGEPGYEPPFRLVDVRVVVDKRGAEMSADATVKVQVGEKIVHTAAEGSGPVHAFDRALRKALIPTYPSIEEVRLADYKVRILNPDEATHATTRVLIEAAAGEARWSTVGCSRNIIEASGQALADSLELFLAKNAKKAPRAPSLRPA